MTRLAKYDLIAFASIVDVARAKEFYRDTLGLTLLAEEPPFALVFDAHGIMLRLGMAKSLPPAHGTVLGWNVPDIETAVKELVDAGVQFERFGQMPQDELGHLDGARRRQSRVVQRPRREYSEPFRTPRTPLVPRPQDPVPFHQH